ncbi:MAG TPA: 2-amino-4-hydroxy-6-hydroxymethyldihydropteridine diphosphokinase [Spirochaetota bacterium]|nr:2-amino-4-hydroxy-6-hydroxymethyldihydropteridine diphosphokinase [Spirochaetota bacterium]HOL56521.1 2-amino-4-hydroxy-6-hydroxymethyldihydropteridine diphosphokinase [Spirochaetota bacterium]HPP03945.1 2-amino-4-hydroxy-6-hydroxymethyldihydropteridine diphosphokinase [Spirochaetota bacterium]
MSLDMYLSLGSNIEPREEYLKLAIENIRKYFVIEKISPIYETEPVDDLEQANFLNLSLFCRTEIKDPLKNLRILKDIEHSIGRKKDEKRPKGPRTIDIDIIFLSDIKYNSEELTIPHKSFLKRNFVLIPLSDIIEDNLKEKYNFKKHISENKNQIVKKIGDLNIG